MCFCSVHVMQANVRELIELVLWNINIVQRAHHICTSLLPFSPPPDLEANQIVICEGMFGHITSNYFNPGYLWTITGCYRALIYNTHVATCTYKDTWVPGFN